MEMGSHSHPTPLLEEEEEEDEYINMEITPYPPPPSSPLSKDFEFQQHFSSTAAEPSASDLFYRGKLLPLRRPLTSSTAPCTTSHTPSDSCNISPSESCRPSCDLTTTTAALFEWPTDVTAFFLNNNNNNNNQPRNSSSSSSWWKMKLNKRSYLAHKLKSSRAYLKSLFFDHNTNPTSRIANKFPATLIKKNAAAAADDHRRSFSGAIAADSSSSSSSSSGSFGSRGRRSSAEEIEVSIDAAIAHCKKSMLSFGV